MTLLECRLALSAAYNAWYATERREQLIGEGRMGSVLPARKNRLAAYAEVVRLEHKLFELLKVYEEEDYAA